MLYALSDVAGMLLQGRYNRQMIRFPSGWANILVNGLEAASIEKHVDAHQACRNGKAMKTAWISRKGVTKTPTGRAVCIKQLGGDLVIDRALVCAVKIACHEDGAGALLDVPQQFLGKA